jgi:hypothetical protein
MEEDRMPKKIFTQKLERTKRRGRPRKGWREVVQRDLRVLGVRRWRELVTDREKWRDIFRQAKAQTGCSVNGRRKRKEEIKENHVNKNFGNTGQEEAQQGKKRLVYGDSN